MQPSFTVISYPDYDGLRNPRDDLFFEDDDANRFYCSLSGYGVRHVERPAADSC
jgi:hypothetical protein